MSTETQGLKENVMVLEHNLSSCLMK